ncbi:MAG TPA: class I SAM-dependent methyltransferase [Caulobacteraceae bacterium]|jgi:SAM-dependent methyltransferase
MSYQGPNGAQAEFWNETAGPIWVELQERLDNEVKPLGDEALRALAPAPGERILDIGCGCGQTSVQIAESVGPSGEVVGLDISAPMLAVARARTPPPGTGRVSFIEGDAQTTDLGAARFDAAFSRFGWMFFADPVAAFANIRSALKPGGRLAMVTWRSFAENPLFTAPGEAAAKLVAVPPPADPSAPGPFRYADAASAKKVLSDAGYVEIAVRPFDAPVGATDLDGALALALRMGPLGALLRQTPSLTDKVRPAVRHALERFLTPTGVKIPAAVWIVTARA